MNSSIKGLKLDVYRPGGGTDTTLGGITATHNAVTLIGLRNTADPDQGGRIVPVEAWRVHDVIPDAPPVIAVICRSGVFGDGARTAYLQPVELCAFGTAQTTPGATYGGNLAGTGNARFGRFLSLLLEYPAPEVLPVHDRYER